MQEPKKKNGSTKSVSTKGQVDQSIIDEINKRSKEGFNIVPRTNEYLDDPSPIVQNIGLDQYGQVVDFGESQYDTPDLNPEELLLGGLDEIRAQKQSNLDRWGNAIPRLVSKVGTEIAKTPGYLYALGEAGLTESTLAEAMDNAWLNTLQSLDDKVKEEFAIYTPEAVKNGSLWDNITSTSFWTNEGVDGAGYLISMMAPGAALKAAGLAGKIAKLGTTVKMANNIELGTATLMNTTLESLAETKGTVDNLKLEFGKKIENGEINPKTGNAWTQEEADLAINEAGKGVFMNNMTLLLAPNFIMNKNLLGRFVPSKNTLNKITDKAGNLIEASPLTKKQMLGEYAKTIGTGIFSEGFVEEAGQFAVENYYDKLAKGETDDNLITGLINEYANALSSTEGQKSIFLGAFLGGLGSIRGTKRFKQEQEYTSKLSKMLKENYEGFSTSIDDIYSKDENGDLILRDGQVQINPTKLSQAVANIALENKSSLMKDVYAMLGNKEAYDFITNQEFTRFAMPYLKEEGGLDLLNKHIDLLSNKLTESKAKVGEETDNFEESKYINDLKNKAKKLQDIYNQTDDLISKINLPQFNENPELATQFLNSLSSAAFQEVSKQFYLTDRINDLNSEILQLENSTTAALPQVKLEVDKLKDQVIKHQDALNESIDTYNSLFDSKEVAKAYDEYNSTISELKDKIEKNTKEVEKKEEEKPEYTYNGKPVSYAYTSEQTGEKFYKDLDNPKVYIPSKNLDQNKVAKTDEAPVVPLNEDRELGDLSSKLSTLSQEASIKPPIEERTIDSFVDDVISGEQLTSLEDQQFYDNNKEEIETKLQEKASKETQSEVKYKALNKNVFNRFHSAKLTKEAKHLLNVLDFNSPSVQENLSIKILEKPFEAEDKSLIQSHEISLFYRDIFLGYLMNPDALENVDNTVEENNAYIAEQRELNRELFNYLINSGKESYNVKELVDKGLFTMTTSGGSINQFKGDAKNRPLISQHLELVVKDEKGNPVIVDSKDPDVPVLVGIEKEIEELVSGAGYPNTAITDRYAVAVKQSNGKVQWISAQPATLEDEAYGPLIEDYKKQSIKALKANSTTITDNTINDKFNYSKDQVYFITIPSELKPTIQTISLNAGIKGGLIIDVEYRTKEEHDKVYIPNKDVQKVASIEDLFDLLNEYNDLEILKDYTFDRNTFRKKVSLDSAKDAANQLQMNLDVEEPFKDNTVFLNFSKGIIPSSDKKAVIEPKNDLKKKIETRRKEDLESLTKGLKTARKGDKGIYWTTFKGLRQDYEKDTKVTIKAVSKLGVLFNEEKNWKNFKDKWHNFINITKQNEINAKYDAEIAALTSNTTQQTQNQQKADIADIERRRQELESSREIKTLYDLTKPITEDSKEIISKIEEANKLKKEAEIKSKQAAKEIDEEKRIALYSDANSLYEKAQILDKEIKTSRDSVINNTPIKQAINSTKSIGQKLLNKIKLTAKSNEWVSSMPISKEDFTKLEDAVKRLSVKNMGEVTSNSEVIPDILLIEEINAKYDAELAALESEETIPISKQTKEVKPKIDDKKVSRLLYIQERLADPNISTPEFTQLVTELEELQRQFPTDTDIVFKLNEETTVDKINIEKATKWITDRLPNTISVSDVADIQDNVVNKGATWGAFRDGIVYLSKEAGQGTEYHEAFHGIFRTLLSDKDIRRYLKLAQLERGLPTTKQIDEARKKYNLSDNISHQEISDILLEEYLADKFMNWVKAKNTKVLPGIKGLFQKIWNWIQFTLLNRDSMESLFYSIETGSFKNKQAVLNRFDRPYGAYAYMLIPAGIDKNGNNINLNSSDTEKLIATTALDFFKLKLDSDEGKSDNQLLNKLLNTYKQKSSLTEPMNTSLMAILEPELRADFVKQLIKESHIFTNEASRNLLKKEVLKRSKIFNFETDLNEEDIQDLANSIGDRFDRNASNIGGFGTLSKAIRQLISLTTINEIDKYGRDVTRAIDVPTVYNGIERVLANTEKRDMLKKLKSYSEYNPEIRAFYNKLKDLVNYDEVNNTWDDNSTYNSFVTAFSKARMYYLFSLIDPKNKRYRVGNANQRDVGITQVSKWANNYEFNVIDKQQALKSLTKLANKYLKPSKEIKEKINKPIVDKAVEELKTAFNNIGIELSKGYIKYSVLQNRVLTDDQSDDIKTFEDTFPIQGNDGQNLIQLLGLFKEGNPYIKSDEKTDVDGLTRLRNIADGNAIFDETVGSSNFQNADGETVYDKILASYTIRRTNSYHNNPNALNTKSFDAFKEGHPYLTKYDAKNLFELLKKNPLVNNSNADIIFDKDFNVKIIDGIRQAEVNINKDGTTFENKNKSKREGKTFKKMQLRDTLLTMYGLFDNTRNKTIINEDGSKSKVKFSDYYFKVLEASSTGYTISLPERSLWSNGLTKEAKNDLYSFFEQEFDRIGRGYTEIAKIESSDNPNIPVIKGYHTGTKRAINFWNFKFLSEDVKTELKTLAENKESIPEELSNRVKKQIEDNFNKEYKAHISKLKELDVITQLKTVDGKDRPDMFKNELLPNNFEVEINGEKVVDLNKVGNFFFNDLINSWAYNQLIDGDWAVSRKDEVDFVKRNKGSIAMQETFGEGVSKGAIIKEPYSAEGIQQADAQMWESLDWRIHKLKSLGKFNNAVKSVYDKIINDEELTNEDLKTLNENDATLISDKDVYFDGIHYFKLSSFPLTRAYNSMKVSKDTEGSVKGSNGKYYKALPGREFEFNLQNEMEAKGISYVMPESASKGATKDVSELGNLKANDYQNVYWGKQVATPSGKTYITEPTQKDGLIDSEQDKSLEPVIKKRQELITQRLEVLYQQNLNQLKDQLSSNKEYTLKYILDRFRNTLEDSGADPNLIEFFSKDANNNPKFNLNMPITMSKFEQLFYAHFTKDGLSIKSPGYALILKSDYGVKIARKDDKVITSNELRKGVKYDELTELKHDVKDEDGNVYSEILLPAHFKEMFNLKIGQELTGDILKMLGMRIPTQDKHSMMNLKIVDFLPAQYGSVIIAPKEIVRLSGADFDVDKLYVRRYEHYVDGDGNIKIYGRNGNDIDTRWEEFIKYQKESNTQFDKTVPEKDALLRLGMPTTKLEYAKALKEKGEQNLAILHNEILTTELKLYGNETIREIANTPATLDALQELVDEIGLDSNINNYNVNSVNGKLASKNDIDTGAENIGPAANANMIFNLLAKNAINLFDESGIEFNGEVYNSFNYINSEGKRINDLISTILSAMTDNAKEALAGKFNLTLDTLQPALYMVSLGVPLKQVLQMTTSDILVDYTNRLAKLKGGVKTSVEENLSEAKIATNIIEEYSNLLETDNTNEIAKELEVFNKFLEFQEQSKMFFKISAFIQLNKGFKPSIAENNQLNTTALELGINKDIEDIKKLGVPFDINPVLKGNNQIAKQYEIYKELHNSVAKEFFINKSNLFDYVKGVILDNTKVGKINSQELLKSLDRNLLTYININAYKKYLIDNISKEENATDATKTLNPDVVFGDLFERIQELKAANKDNKLFQYLSLEKSNDIKSLSFNIIAANNRIKIHPVILEQILNDYNELFSNPETKQTAIDLFNYMVIKDGMQFKNRSISKFIAPFMYRMISNSLNNTVNIVKDDAIAEETFSNVFGNNRKDFVEQFINTVFEYEPNSFDYVPYHGKSISKNIMTEEGDNLTIDLFKDYKPKRKATTSAELLDELNEVTEEKDNKLKDNINAINESKAFSLKSDESKKLSIEFPLYIKIGKKTYKIKAIGNSFDIKESDNLMDFIGIDNKASNFKGYITKAVYTKVDTFGDENYNPYASTLAENKEIDKLIKANQAKKSNRLTNIEALERFEEALPINETDIESQIAEAERLSKLFDSDVFEKEIEAQLSNIPTNIDESEIDRLANQLSSFSQEANLEDLNEGDNIIDEDEDPLTPC